jgi:hypothetical protein
MFGRGRGETLDHTFVFESRSDLLFVRDKTRIFYLITMRHVPLAVVLSTTVAGNVQ